MAHHEYSANPPPYATAVPIVAASASEPPAAAAPAFFVSESAEDARGYGISERSADEVGKVQIDLLGDQGFTAGMARSLTDMKRSFPLRIWVVDNSGSMQKPDGHRIVETARKNDVRIVQCTRWDEIRECVNYHCRMAALLEAPTSFRLLNHPGAGAGSQFFGVAESVPQTVESDLRRAVNIMSKARPGGVTPLTSHVREIHRAVEAMAPRLTSEGKRVVIVLATDGLPTDEQGQGGDHVRSQFVQALRLLEGLPVWVVIRLCTDENDVVSFYNDLDEQLELSLEVLDDFTGEAEEVHSCNPWLNYALPLHRLREMGYHDRVFDMIDERPLTRGELRDFCSLLFGADGMDGVPDPSVDWSGFVKEVDSLLKRESPQWNPIKKKVMPWIDVKRLHKCYGDGAACCIM